MRIIIREKEDKKMEDDSTTIVSFIPYSPLTTKPLGREKWSWNHTSVIRRMIFKSPGVTINYFMLT